jgi:hypothetical protein
MFCDGDNDGDGARNRKELVPRRRYELYKEAATFDEVAR